MRKITLPLLLLLAGCFAIRPAPALGVENFLLSAYSLSGTNIELTELETDITVTGNTEHFFVLLTVDVYNQKTVANQITVKFAETGGAVADEVGTFLVPDQGTYRIQLTAEYTGAALGLGAHTWKVYGTGSDLILQTTSSMFIANPIVPSGVISSLNGETAAVQSFAYNNGCAPFPGWSSASGVHTFCIPDASTSNSQGGVTNAAQSFAGFKQFTGGIDANGVGANTVLIGLLAQAPDASGVVVGDSAQVAAQGLALGKNANAGDDAVAAGFGAVASDDSIAVGSGASTGAAGECSFGSPTYPMTDICGGEGCESASPSAFAYRGTNGTGTDIASAETRLYGGRSTGAGACGAVVVGTCTPGGAGSSLNAIVKRWQVDSDGHFLPILADVYDVGSGTYRPRYVYGGIRSNVGAAPAPSISFDLDPDTGMYRPQTNYLAVATGGVRAWVCNGSQDCTFDGVVDGPVGAVGAPSYTFTGDLDTGIYRVGADQFGIAAGGALGAQVDVDATAGNTRFLLYDVDNATLERVTVGAADSGGAGYKLLRIPN